MKKLALAALIAAGTLCIALAGMIALAAVRGSLFPITKFDVTGCVTVNARHVLELSGIASTESLLFVSLAAVRRAIETDPLIRVVRISRRFPGTLAVTIAERQPLAIFVHNGLPTFVSADGMRFSKPLVNWDMPVLSGFPAGMENPLTNAELTKAIAVLADCETNERALYDLVSEIVWHEREYIVYPRGNRVQANFGTTIDREKLRKLCALLAMRHARSLSMTFIDLRFENAVIR